MYVLPDATPWHELAMVWHGLVCLLPILFDGG